ncbi:iron-containing alcohol dehydrogenase [Shigella flexneri]
MKLKSSRSRSRPTLSIVRKGAELANSFKPDVIIALGSDAPMDAAKISGLCTNIRKLTSKSWRCAYGYP